MEDVVKALAKEVLSSADIEWNPPPGLLRRESSRYAGFTKTGSLAVVSSKARARRPDRTRVKYLRDEGFDRLVVDAWDYVVKASFYAVERCVGSGDRRFRILALVEKSYPHLALMSHLNFFPCGSTGSYDMVTIDVPSYSDVWMLVERRSNSTLVLGSDYYGELKMSFLRLAMNEARDRHLGVGLHAASKLYRVRVEGSMREVGVLVFGLSGTGKTTLTVEDHGLREPEYVRVMQDDIVILDWRGVAHGTEMNLYPKTDSVPELKKLEPAVLHPDAVLENVVVKSDGTPDFTDLSLTRNARALAIREAIPIASGSVDLMGTNVLVFLTRRPEMPPLARLTSPYQAVAYFMLGESFRTSAEAGKPEPVRVPGFDPFMLEPKWRSAYSLLDLIKSLNMNVYVMNTGHAKDRKIPPELSKHLLLSLVKENVDWKLDKHMGFEIAVRAGGVNLDGYNPEELYGESYVRVVDLLRRDRQEFLRSIPSVSFLADYV
ncbi:phosphoenolpyruvate carboxykinase [ATP] [Aeropyrum pernix K1]|uniref:Phosphoenolpyruvate carboxykinase (ATP) n=1 Tax=Aeropyrum pernix (strain ATCC 700893 / DSM 11879 / JCM 9820 / NBRC 100138 / K1) TaxID=272557 RepID=PCKA_AERPE|nr:phosphoenolpyruvate carboxykinase [Aeropyrum pernix]Q9YG68.2 RecName: Full=Phosphoenolpyruvate carboxykinase (ATP); Short=PCK; Short=PEP carboxykinase; Short=PEPCK [Aeropyrum pernix K1]BAA78942.2 phosphoenolpyruvate carboxykinase [ATP] [Aeropyrum pernix K1]